MIGRVNTGGGTGGTLMVTAPAGVTVTVSKDGKTKTKTAWADGLAVFKGLKSGQWTLTITDGEQTATKTVEITTDYSTVMSFNQIPSFDYSGDCEIVNDADEPITVSQDNWKIRFLTSGTLTFTCLNGAADGIDVFVVGGGGGGGSGKEYFGGGGGGGGYVQMAQAVSVEVGTSYDITVGAGGVANKDGGNTEAFNVTAIGGKKGHISDDGSGDIADGGNGGSGGGQGSVAERDDGKSGGSNGSKGYGTYGGKGGGSTTGEFGASSNTLYAGGGGGGGGTYHGTNSGSGGGGSGGGGAGGNTNTKAWSGTQNSGGGGGGGFADRSGASGGSGIVIIRNAREVA